MKSIVLQEVIELADKLPLQCMADFEKQITSANRLFFYAVGRCGLVLRMFAMRLMHLGFTCHVIGEVTTPSITKDDLLVTASGSGRTPTVQAVIQQAKAVGTPVTLLTSSQNLLLRDQVNYSIGIPGTSKLDVTSRQPPGSIFEQMLLCFLEETIYYLMRSRHVDAHAIMARHANVE